MGASVPECCRLARRRAAEARWAYRASMLTIDKSCRLTCGFAPEARGNGADRADTQVCPNTLRSAGAWETLHPSALILHPSPTSTTCAREHGIVQALHATSLPTPDSRLPTPHSRPRHALRERGNGARMAGKKPALHARVSKNLTVSNPHRTRYTNILPSLTKVIPSSKKTAQFVLPRTNHSLILLN